MVFVEEAGDKQQDLSDRQGLAESTQDELTEGGRSEQQSNQARRRGEERNAGGRRARNGGGILLGMASKLLGMASNLLVGRSCWGRKRGPMISL